MRLLACLLIVCCIASSCKKSSGDGAVNSNDTTHHDTTYHSPYPYSAKYSGTMRVICGIGEYNTYNHTGRDVEIDSSYNETVIVDYPDSNSLIVQFAYWAHLSEATYQDVHYVHADSTRFVKRADGVYHIGIPQNIDYKFRGDSLIIQQQYYPSHYYACQVWFYGAKSR